MSATLEEPFVAEPPPLRRDASGTLRVGGTRVTLDIVIGAYQSGASAEEIVDAYDVLSLADVHSVISYYLRHREAIESYLSERQQKAEESQRRIEAQTGAKEFREGLLARQRARDQS